MLGCDQLWGEVTGAVSATAQRSGQIRLGQWLRLQSALWRAIPRSSTPKPDHILSSNNRGVKARQDDTPPQSLWLDHIVTSAAKPSTHISEVRSLFRSSRAF